VCGSRWNSRTHNWTKSSASCLQNLNWPSLHNRRSYFAIAQVHVIIHKKISIRFDSHFKFRDNHTRSHPLSLVASSSSINAYWYSFFINSPFLWTSIPIEILQITKFVPFRLALRRFFVSLITVYIFVFCICFCSCHVLLYVLALVVFVSVTVCVCHCKLGSMFAGIPFYVTHVF